MISTLSPESGIFQTAAFARSLVIIGLPASGKTSYARSLLEGRSHYEDIHHWLYYRDQHVRDGDDRFGRFLADLEAGRPWVIDSVEMCEREVRERFVGEYLTRLGEVDWLFFENDPFQCKSNAQVLEHRGEGHRTHRLREIERVTAVYDIPAGATVRPVYRSADRIGVCTTGTSGDDDGSAGRAEMCSLKES